MTLCERRLGQHLEPNKTVALSLSSVVKVRLRYIHRPNSDLFVIYNQSTGAGIERPSYSFQIKLTRDFTF